MDEQRRIMTTDDTQNAIEEALDLGVEDYLRGITAELYRRSHGVVGQLEGVDDKEAKMQLKNTAHRLERIARLVERGAELATRLEREW